MHKRHHHNQFVPPSSQHGIMGGAVIIDKMKGLTPPGDGHTSVPQGQHPIHMTPPHPDRLRMRKLPKKF